MKIDKKISEELRNKAVQMINEADPEKKGEAIIEAMAMIAAEANRETVEMVLQESRSGNRSNLRTLSEREVAFYNALKAGPEGFKQSVTAAQIDIIPTEVIDFTLNNVKKPSGIRRLISYAPANVKKWLIGAKTGASAWGNLTDQLTAELTATLTSLNMDVFKLHAFCVIPKAIRELEIGYVDRYFTAILNEAMEDGIVKGYLYGDGKVAPIGICKQIGSVNGQGEHIDKVAIQTITGFSPVQMAPVLSALSNGGLRPVSKVYLICNPLDRYQYVNPALYGDSISGGYVSKSFIDMEVIEDANVTRGDGIFTLDGVYTMGFQGVKVDEYKETKALDDADLIIAKVYGNGRAVDDNAAVVFDIEQLLPYVPTVLTTSNP